MLYPLVLNCPNPHFHLLLIPNTFATRLQLLNMHTTYQVIIAILFSLLQKTNPIFWLPLTLQNLPKNCPQIKYPPFQSLQIPARKFHPQIISSFPSRQLNHDPHRCLKPPLQKPLPMLPPLRYRYSVIQITSSRAFRVTILVPKHLTMQRASLIAMKSSWHVNACTQMTSAKWLKFYLQPDQQ